MNRILLSMFVLTTCFTYQAFAHESPELEPPRQVAKIVAFHSVQLNPSQTDQVTCTVTLGSWVKLGLVQFWINVTATAETCGEAATNAADQMSYIKSFASIE